MRNCKECEWREIYEGVPICGYIAEVYHVKVIIPRRICFFEKQNSGKRGTHNKIEIQ